MKPSISVRVAAAAVLLSAALGAASAAHATGNVYFSVGLQGVPVYPIYAPARVYEATSPSYRNHGHEQFDRTYESRGRYERRDGYRDPTHWDRDGDGIPNRHDRLHNPRWDVDGDGIPNRHDRFYNPPQRFHDGGRTDRFDRWDGRHDRHGR